MPNTYVALRTETVATATNSVTFSLSGISGYTDLVLVINNTHSTNAVDGWFRLNGDTGSNYSRTNLNGDGTSATSGRNSNVAFGYGILVLTTPSTNILQFMNYANTTTNKTVLMRSNNAGSGGYVQATVDLWRNTAAITSIEIGCVSGNFAVGSTFSLYGIANADQGSAKATGGIITEDSQYWYHTFGASGAFIPKQSLTCDVLVVAGGGGGGRRHGGGGGAGGVSYQAGRSVPVATYNITVGGGGAGGGAASPGATGTNSVFDTITSNGGGGGGGGSNSALTGGAGGGGSGFSTFKPGAAATQGNTGGATGYGFAGGSGNDTTNNLGGGGGGSGAVGANAVTATTPGNGGAGRNDWSTWSVVTGTGVDGFYAGGGGGGGFQAGTSIGGSGGGGNGTNTTTPGNGVTNTGSGGGGQGNDTVNGGTGGSGVVIIRYSK